CGIFISASCFFQKVVEDPFSVQWAGHSLGMELYGVEGILVMAHPFVTTIIGVDKPGSKIWRQYADCKAMILGSGKTLLCIVQNTGLILAPVPILQLIGIAPSGQREQLMTEANTQNRNPAR